MRLILITLNIYAAKITECKISATNLECRFLTYFSRSRLIRSPCRLCVYNPLIKFRVSEPIFINPGISWYQSQSERRDIYISLSVCISPRVPRQRLGMHVLQANIYATVDELSGGVVFYTVRFVSLCIPQSLFGNRSVFTFPRRRRIFGNIVFCAVRVVPKEK
jgi:hypothetical protein